jgi:sugar phosphate isomerase/epimerase
MCFFRNFPFHQLFFAMPSRRQFIYQSALLTAATTIDPSGVFKKKKELGIQFYTVRNEVSKNLDNAVAQVAAAGYTQVELFGYNQKDRTYFGRTIKEIVELFKKNKLKTPSGHYLLTDMLYDESYNWDSWKYAVEDARTLGHQYIVIPWLDDKHRTADNFKRVAERLNKGGEISKSAGITTAYHNHNFEFDKIMGGETAWEYLLKNTEEALVKFEMDIYWVYYAKSTPLEWFKKYPGRFPLWHVKDMEAGNTETPIGQSCEVGNGIINFKEAFDNKKLAGLKCPFVEQEAYRKPVFECIKTSADYLKKNFI